MLNSCDTLSMSINKASLPMQKCSTDGLPECYVRLVRLPENITPTQTVKTNECVSTSQQHISSKNCHYIVLDNHSSYCLTCKQLIQDFHQFKQNVQSRRNESSFCSSSFNRHKGSECRGLSTHVNKLSGAAVETELNVNEDEEKNQDQNFINKRKSKIYVYKCFICQKQCIHKGSLVDHMNSHTNEILETTDPIVAANQNLKDERKDVELKNEEAIKVETETNSRIICSSPLSNASEEDILQPHFQDIKIKIEKPLEMEEPNQSCICSICRRYCGTSARLKKHMLAHEKPYKCNICNMRLSYRKSLNRHILCHTGIKRFACHICHNCYTTKVSLACHIKTHIGEKPYPCKQCDFAGKTRSELRKHCKCKHLMDKDTRKIRTARRKATVCPICNKKILELNRHLLTHTGEKPFECNICQKRYTSKTSLDFHLKSHTGEKPFCCAECDYSAKTNKQVRRHYNRMHTVKVANSDGNNVNTKKTDCPICNKGVLLLKRHMLTHTGEKPFECNICHNRYTTKNSLKYHIKSHTGEKLFHCKECDYSAYSHKLLRYHCWSRHNKPTEMEGEPKQSNICSVCGKYCGTPIHLKKHMSVHAKPYKCKICNMDFSYRRSLNRHVLRHTGIKQFVCHICHNRYTTKSSLECHIKTHTGEKPYPCKECDFAGKMMSELRQHCKRKHLMHEDTRKIQTESKKATVCPICNKTIFDLRRHMLTHTDEKTFRCAQCDYSGKTKKHVREHCNRMHTVKAANSCPICNKKVLALRPHLLTHSGKKPFECNICHIRYKSKDSLEFHLKSHTGEKPFCCTECDYSAKTNKQVGQHYNRIHAVKVVNSDGNNVNTKKTVCPICNKRILQLKRHMLIHTGEKPFKCDICHNRYTTKVSLEFHLKSHTGEKPFRCTECDYLAKTDKQVRYHYKRKHTDKVKRTNGNISHFQIFEAMDPTSKRVALEEDVHESHSRNIKIEILEATDAASEPHFDTISNASDEDVYEPNFQNIKIEVLEATYPTSEPGFETLSDAFEEDKHEAHLRNLKGNICEAVDPFEEPEHIQNSIHEEVEVKDKAMHVNTHNEVKTETSKATDLIETIKPEEVQIKDELIYKDNQVFTICL